MNIIEKVLESGISFQKKERHVVEKIGFFNVYQKNC